MSAIRQVVSGSAEIEGIGSLDVESIDIRYAPNEIPQGSVGLALGERAGGSRGSPAITALRSELGVRRRITIKLGVGGHEDVVFEGYTAGVMPQRSGDAAALTISVMHWLVDLETFSAFSAALTPAALSALDIPARCGVRGGGGVGVGSTIEGIRQAVAHHLAASGDLGAAIIDVLNMFTAPHMATKMPISNAVAQQAIARLTADLKFRFIDSSNIACGISETIGSIMTSTYSGNTLWQCLLALSQQFNFVVIPGVSSAAIVPYIPGLSAAATSAHHITADKLALARSGVAVRPALRGVRLYMTLFSLTNNGLRGAAPEPVAIYVDSGTPDGMIDSAAAPAWLQTRAANDNIAVTYENGVSGRTTISRARAIESELIADIDPTELKIVGTEVAKAVMYERIFEGGSGSLDGSYDPVSPGTLVLVEVPESRGAAGADVAAYISATRFVVHAAQSLLQYSIELSHLRDVETDAKAPAEHPLYAGAAAAVAAATGAAAGNSLIEIRQRPPGLIDLRERPQ